MMSPQMIRAIAQEKAQEAAAEGKVPFVYWDATEVDEYRGFPFPFLGDYVPEGWELVDDTHFVDSSGFGSLGERAMTGEQFAQLIKERLAEAPGTGWAVTEAGQFQVYVGEYRRKEST